MKDNRKGKINEATSDSSGGRGSYNPPLRPGLRKWLGNSLDPFVEPVSNYINAENNYDSLDGKMSKNNKNVKKKESVSKKIRNKDWNIEVGEEGDDEYAKAPYKKVKHNFTNPTLVNPTMNILLPEIQDNPNRLASAPSYKKPVVDKINEETKKFILSNFDNSENIREKLFNSGINQFDSNNFDFEQSMRQFYTTANTKIPNNQAEFAKFCYGNMASCRDGDVEMCSRNIPRHVML